MWAEGDDDDDYSAEVFVYKGPGGESPPQNVVRVRVDPSVVSIPACAFKINIPTSLRRINDEAFYRSLRTPIRLNDGIESIGARAFASCIFTNF